MGFGFNLFFSFVLFPLICGLLLLRYLFGIRFAGLALRWVIGGISVLFVLSIVCNWLFSTKVLTKADYYGSYIIDRNQFPGRQADWQYNHFRFEITKGDKIEFQETDGERIIRTHRGTISTTTGYPSARLIVHMDTPVHPIFTTPPTIYRGPWGFYLVCYSPRFKNVFFRKGSWHPL